MRNQGWLAALFVAVPLVELASCATSSDVPSNPVADGGTDNALIRRKDAGGILGDGSFVGAKCEPPATLKDTYEAPGAGAGINRGLCTEANVNGYLEACAFSSSADKTKCAAWMSANASCGACLGTGFSATPSGAFLVSSADNLVESFNFEACIDSFEPGCGPAALSYLMCRFDACNDSPGQACSLASPSEKATCVEKANGTVCKAQFDAYNGKCKTAFGLSSRSAPKPALVCLPTATESESAFGLRFGLLVCGGSKDGGTDASVIDGSSGDASTDAATDASSSTDASTDASPGNDDAGTDAATDGATDAGTDGATGLWAPADPRGRFVEGFRAARFRGEIEANEGEGQGR